MSELSHTNASLHDEEENTFVVTRTGRKVLLDPNRITQRLKQLSRRKPQIRHVNPAELMLVVAASLKSGISTYEIDEYCSDTATSLSLTNPHYMKLASRIVVDNHQKATGRSFTDKMSKAYLRTDTNGIIAPLLSKEFFAYVEKHQDDIEKMIEYTRDFLFDYFGFRTFQRLYGIKLNGVVIERPQDMYMRCAIAIHMNTKRRTDNGLAEEIRLIKETYDLLSNKLYTQASPTYFNAGTNHAQFSSCFLMGTSDSLEGIMGTWEDAAAISKRGGGIGIHVNNWRSAGALIRGTNGTSSGVVPFLRIGNNVMRAFNQGGKRMGSAAIYMMPHHPDIMEFLRLKLPGGEETERAHDLFYAMWIPDLFMERVILDANWSLFDPDQTVDLSDYTGEAYTAKYIELENAGKFTKQLKARAVWEAIYISNEQRGVPYIAFADHANRMSNQKNIGVIKSSNLCVSGDTRILTNYGYRNIKTLTNSSDGKHTIWNGFEFAKAQFAKTGIDKDLLKITFSDGVEIKCTKEHKFIMSVEYCDAYIELTADKLTIGDKLFRHIFPIIDECKDEFKYPYTHGFFCGNETGIYQDINESPIPYADLYHDKREIKQHIEYIETPSVNEGVRRERLRLNFDIAKKFVVPFRASLSDRLLWLAGYLDADGMITKNNDAWCIQVSCTNRKFLMNVKLFCNMIGTNPLIHCMAHADMKSLPDGESGSKMYRMSFNAEDTKALYDLGLDTHRLVWDNKTLPVCSGKRYISVKSVEKLDGKHDTYCFNEPIMHMGIFNGVIAGNCIEIMEFSNNEEHAVCNLCSSSLAGCVFDRWDPKELEQPEEKRRELDHEFPLNPYFDYTILRKLIKVAAVNLDNIIDKNLYPTEKTKRSNMRHRPIGIGIQGMADAFLKMRFPFESQDAAILNKHMLEAMMYAALSQSTRTCRDRYIELVRECNEHGSVTVDVHHPDHYEITKHTYTDHADIPKTVAAYPSMKWNGGSPIWNGEFHWEMYGLETKELSGMWDWETLRGHIQTYGVRNSLVIALMPTASTSQLLGNNECFEPYTSNIYKRKTLAGEFIVINKYLINDLYRLGLWNKNMKNYLLSLEGSIQMIEGIPDEIKELYKTAWEIDQILLIERAAARQPFVDQSQSLNLYVEDIDITLFNRMMFKAWRLKLKTGKYYLHTRPASMPQKFTIDPDKQVEMAAIFANEQETRKATQAAFLEPLAEQCDLCSG